MVAKTPWWDWEMWRLFLSTRRYGSQVPPAQSLATRCSVVQGGRHCQGLLRKLEKGKGRITPFSRLEGWACHLGWAGDGETGGRGGRTRQVLKD